MQEKCPYLVIPANFGERRRGRQNNLTREKRSVQVGVSYVVWIVMRAFFDRQNREDLGGNVGMTCSDGIFFSPDLSMMKDWAP